MAILKIILEDDPLLRKKSKPVDNMTPRIITLLDDMKDTLIKSQGVGLAAPQVGILRRVFLIYEIDENTGNERIIEFINPKIIHAKGTQESMEGCLSIPGKCGITKRPTEVLVEALDREGKSFIYMGKDLYAKALCHENDHLNGILYTDNVIRMLDPEEWQENE